MAKPMDPLKVLNTMAGAAHKKAQPPKDPAEPDADDMPAPKAKKDPKQVAAMNEKKHGKMPPMKK